MLFISKHLFLGFIGRIKEWIDLELIRQVAEARPEWSIIMVGPVELDADISAFSNLPNVYFVGSKTKEELPAYLKKFDVCLNPFRAGKLSKAVNPLKLYEYLSAGKRSYLLLCRNWKPWEDWWKSGMTWMDLLKPLSVH
jgi:glycosyltransferase involved in cell wall biosynthesis